MSDDAPTTEEPGWLARVLSVFSEVRTGEATIVLTMTLNLFLILTAYYVIKTVREPLILADPTGGAEVKSYASAGQAALLVILVPVYSWFASRVDRMRLIWGVTAFLVLCIEGFYGLAYLGVPRLGVAFYIWVGVFNLAVIAQFWSFANDLYSKPAGERLFPIVGVGATVGAAVGALVAGQLFAFGVGAYEMMQVAAVLLLISAGLYTWVNQRAVAAAPQDAEAESIGTQDGFVLVLRNPYLRLIAVLLILLNVVNTTGEYILSATVTEAAQAAAAADPTIDVGAWIGAFYGNFFFWVNIVTVLLQAFAVSRLVKYLGIAGVLFALPVVAFGAYGLVAAGVGLSVLRVAKSAENATDYSIMNTARAMLWLPTTREEKYKAKQAIDTFFVRLGDVLSAGVVFVGTTTLAWGVPSFALFNLVVIAAWAAVAYRVWQRYTAVAPPEDA